MNIEDSLNAYVQNVYTVTEEAREIISLPFMASSSSLIVSYVYNVMTSERIIRVFDRNSSHMNEAKFLYTPPFDSKSNYFYFPNFYSNTILYRDERRVNITDFFDYKLVLNATNTSLVGKYNMQAINVSIQATNGY